MPAHRERELACARGSAGRPAGQGADNSTACSAPRARRALSAPAIASSHQQPTQQSSPLRPSWRRCRCHVGRAASSMRAQGVGASGSPRRRWRRSRRSRNGGGQPRGSTRQEACQRWAAPARAARIAPQQVRLEGWSTRLSGRRKGGCGENGTYAPPEVLDTNDGPQPARHGQQGRCRRS